MARKAEDHGYSTFHLADHYLGEGTAYTEAAHPPQSVAAVPAMVAAAAVTETIKIGCRVFCCDYHNPVVLAKEMATIDLMSDGRLEAGFGAGWITSEYEAIGIPMDRPGIRIARMAEYIEFSKQFFAGGQMDYHGTYVQATGFEALPVSPQPGGPEDHGRRRLAEGARHRRQDGRHRVDQLRQLGRQDRRARPGQLHRRAHHPEARVDPRRSG